MLRTKHSTSQLQSTVRLPTPIFYFEDLCHLFRQYGITEGIEKKKKMGLSDFLG